jgi:PAS domain S-box-containing protein
LTAWNDITEFREAEKRLRWSEERFAKAFYANPNAMVISEWLSGCLILVNDSFLEVTGFRREEIIGGSVVESSLWLDHAQREQAMLKLSQGGTDRNREMTFVCKNGEHKMGIFSAEIIELDGQMCMLSTVSDVTELKRMQQEVARLESFNLIGQMAAGIGHEIRNPMTCVRGFLQILGSKIELVPYQGWIKLMIEELDRANAIITEYLSLAKNKTNEYMLLYLNDILGAIAPLIEADALGTDKYIEWNLGEVPPLFLNPDEIKQLVLNLVRNGLEAITAGGRLIVSTYLDMSDIILAVRDSGGGIPQEVLDQLGTPFVTTKESGTGLGLALCYAIAARHNAKIDVTTGKEGTTFFVRFNIEKPLR